jgi:hypothetical protein
VFSNTASIGERLGKYPGTRHDADRIRGKA